MRTKVLVADPFAIFRAGVHNLLRREKDFAVVEAEDLRAIQKLVGAECPDIALIDLELPPVGGVAAVEWLDENCSTHTIVWSFEPDREIAQEREQTFPLREATRADRNID